MATFKLEIECDNAAFDGRGGPIPEIARILDDVRRELDRYHAPSGTIRDENGNKVGYFEFTE